MAQANRSRWQIPEPPADPEAPRHAGRIPVVLIIVLLVVAFLAVFWLRYHRSVAPVNTPLREKSSLNNSHRLLS